MDDGAEFGSLVSALELLGFSKGEQNDVFRVLAGILHLGNVAVGGGSESAELGGAAEESLSLLCQSLWGLSEADLRRFLHRTERRPC